MWCEIGGITTFKMGLAKYCLILLAVISCTTTFEGLGFRSSWHDGIKPILRLGPDEVPKESDPETLPGPPGWTEDLRSRIYSLVQLHGYEDAKPYILKLVNDTEDREKALLLVEGNSKVDYKLHMRAAESPPTTPPDPAWISDFKDYIKGLVQRYGRAKIDDYLRPVMEYVEKLHHVYIKDIDVDEYGEVFVTYINKPGIIG